MNNLLVAFVAPRVGFRAACGKLWRHLKDYRVADRDPILHRSGNATQNPGVFRQVSDKLSGKIHVFSRLLKIAIQPNGIAPEIV